MRTRTCRVCGCAVLVMPCEDLAGRRSRFRVDSLLGLRHAWGYVPYRRDGLLRRSRPHPGAG